MGSEEYRTLDKRFVLMSMRWLIAGTLACAIGMAAISPAWAIEKQKKDNPPAKPDTTSVAKPQPTPTKPPVTPAIDPRQNPKIFNDFIDVNNNGIDDRLEQGGYLIPPKQQPKPMPAVKKTDSAKAEPVKKPADTEKKKDK